MQPTGIDSLALVIAAAALFSTAEAHGQMLKPVYRPISDQYLADSGALINIGSGQLQIAPIEGLSQNKQADFPVAETFNLMNGCRGTVYEEGNTVTTLALGADFDVEWTIQAPHPGYMNLSIVKPKADSVGKITYEIYETILTIEPFAEHGGEDSATATMPTDIVGCEEAGDCALQFYWHSDIAGQTYPTCADIIVSGSGAGTATTTTTAPVAASEAGSDETVVESDEGSEETGAEASTTTAPTTATASPTATPMVNIGDSDSKCSRRRVRRD
ncbi:hypothetical protein BBJ28_00018043 [Nothophytophthora sp. Chile5]|nr:hypothetical protein BBJ28_00018043 [Nothophytophthora sp. Chile5]